MRYGARLGHFLSGLCPFPPPPFLRQSMLRAPVGDASFKSNFITKHSPLICSLQTWMCCTVLAGDVQQLAAAFLLLLETESSPDLPPSLPAAVQPLHQPCTLPGEPCLPLFKVHQHCRRVPMHLCWLCSVAPWRGDLRDQSRIMFSLKTRGPW